MISMKLLSQVKNVVMEQLTVEARMVLDLVSMDLQKAILIDRLLHLFQALVATILVDFHCLIAHTLLLLKKSLHYHSFV